MLVLLIKAKLHPDTIDDLIKEFCIEMQEEDVALVKREMGLP